MKKYQFFAIFLILVAIWSNQCVITAGKSLFFTSLTIGSAATAIVIAFVIAVDEFIGYNKES